MKYIHGILTTLAAGLLLAACSADSASVENELPQAQFILNGSIYSEATTRSVNTALQTTKIAVGNTVGAFILRKGETAAQTVDGEAYGYLNKEFTSVDATTQLYSPEQPLFPAKGTGDQKKVDIYAYAPRNAAWTSLAAQTFTVKADQTSDANYIASDLLWGTRSGNVDPTDPAPTYTGSAEHDGGTLSYQLVPFRFRHMLTQIQINVTAGDGVSASDLKGTTVKLINAGNTGSIDLTDGTITQTGKANYIDVFKYGYKQDGTTEDASCTGGVAIVYPHTAAQLAGTVDSKPVKVQLTFNSFTFSASLATANITEWEQYKKYTYNVRISSDGISFSAAISPWDTSEADRPVTPVFQ